MERRREGEMERRRERRRDGERERQRDGETERRRDGETESQREGENVITWWKPNPCVFYFGTGVVRKFIRLRKIIRLP